MRLSKSTGIAALAVGTAAIALTGGAGSAGATTQLHVTKTISSDFVGPLQFAVDGRRIFVADSFISALFRVGRPAPIATGGDPATGGDLAGVAVDPHTHTIAYTTNNGDHSVTTLTIKPNNAKPTVADLSGYEASANPDKINHYGTVGKVNACARDAIRDATGLPARYRGQIDSHAYSVTAIGRGKWAVADAGGNDIVKVDAAGHVSTIAVLPPQPLTVTADYAAAIGLPACTVGVTYKFEPVPTDVEVGPDGHLYVTTLPGGPEGVPGGAAGSVYRITSSGKAKLVATGIAGATNLAISPSGRIYVVGLGSGTISVIKAGAPVTVAELPGVVAVEYANGRLYASIAPALIGSSDPGSIVQLG